MTPASSSLSTPSTAAPQGVARALPGGQQVFVVSNQTLGRPGVAAPQQAPPVMAPLQQQQRPPGGQGPATLGVRSVFGGQQNNFQ